MKLKKMLKFIALEEPVKIQVCDKCGDIVDEIQVDDASKLSKDILNKKVFDIYSMFDRDRYLKTLDDFNCTCTIIEVDEND